MPLWPVIVNLFFALCLLTVNNYSKNIQTPTSPGGDLSSKLSDLSISDNDSSLSSSISLSSLPSDNWVDEIERYRDEMPPDMRIGFYDVLILYCEHDREAATEFRSHLIKEIDVGSKGPIKVVLYDEAELEALSNMKIGHLGKAVERSTYVFIFLTKNFIDDKWMEFSSESCLMEAITNPNKQWCVVPVYTERRNTSFRVPMGLNTLKGINYYNNDKFYRKGVAALILGKIQERRNSEKKHRVSQMKWIEDYKREMIIRRENELRLQIIEEEKTRQLTLRLTQEALQYKSAMEQFPHSVSSGNICQHPVNGLSVPHSYSLGDLKQVQPQNPAVSDYVNELKAQTKQVQFVEQTRGVQVQPGMNEIQDQYNFGNLKRSTSHGSSTICEDMGSGAVYQVRSRDFPTTAVTVPHEFCEKIKHLPKQEQEKFVVMYFEERQRQFGSAEIQYNHAVPSVTNQEHVDPRSVGYLNTQTQGVPDFDQIKPTSMSGQWTAQDLSMKSHEYDSVSPGMNHYPSGIQHGEEQSFSQDQGRCFNLYL